MADKVKDPVCGMEIGPEDAVATELHEGRSLYFSGKTCHDTFVNDPHRYGHPTEDHGGHTGLSVAIGLLVIAVTTVRLRRSQARGPAPL